jgi:hypothetical protein
MWQRLKVRLREVEVDNDEYDGLFLFVLKRFICRILYFL